MSADTAAPAPATVGCVRCGAEYPARLTVFEQCEACGKICGLCLGCAGYWAQPLATASRTQDLDFRGARAFLVESMVWHVEQRHRLSTNRGKQEVPTRAGQETAEIPAI